MRRTNRLFSMGLALLAMLLAGCARSPDREIARAKSALDAAAGIESGVYAKEAFAHAQEALEEAMREVEAQEATPFFSRSYTQARELLDRATNAAHEALAEAERAREEAKVGSQASLQEAKLAVSSAREVAENARVPRAVKDEWKDGVESASENLFEAENAFEAGKYLEAQARAEDAKAEADEVAGEARDRARRG